VIRKDKEDCKRPYSLGKRLETSDRTRAKILDVTRTHLESNGFSSFTLEGLARESGVTRQTVHNLFGTKAEVLEALFDQIALDAGLEKMRFVMTQTDARDMLRGLVDVFVGFWKKDRLLLRRVHGIAAIDPEFGAAVQARNQRRRGAAARVVGLLAKGSGGHDSAEKASTLYALTSFEFYDSIADGCGDEEEAARIVRSIVEMALL
jgi:AcrR family transcriptional regulator